MATDQNERKINRLMANIAGVLQLPHSDERPVVQIREREFATSIEARNSNAFTEFVLFDDGGKRLVRQLDNCLWAVFVSTHGTVERYRQIRLSGESYTESSVEGGRRWAYWNNRLRTMHNTLVPLASELDIRLARPLPRCSC